MTLILDTRFLVAHAFPPSDEDRVRIREFMRRIAKEELLLSFGGCRRICWDLAPE